MARKKTESAEALIHGKDVAEERARMVGEATAQFDVVDVVVRLTQELAEVKAQRDQLAAAAEAALGELDSLSAWSDLDRRIASRLHAALKASQR